MTEPMTDEQLKAFEYGFGYRSDGDAHAVHLCCREIRRLRAEVKNHRDLVVSVNKAYKELENEFKAEVERMKDVVAEFIAGEEDPSKYEGEVTRLQKKLAAHEEAMRAAAEYLEAHEDTRLKNLDQDYHFAQILRARLEEKQFCDCGCDGNTSDEHLEG